MLGMVREFGRFSIPEAVVGALGFGSSAGGSGLRRRDDESCGQYAPAPDRGLWEAEPGSQYGW